MTLMKEIIDKIKGATNIALFAHISPDPDAIGSLGAMSFALKQLGKNCHVILSENLQEKYNFLKIENILYDYEPKYDLIISLDVSSLNRLGKFGDVFLKHNNCVAIDHHKIRTPLAKIEYVDYTCASTCNILFSLFEKMEIKITKEIANCLYLGIVTDCGGFMFSNTTPQTLVDASKLMQFGANTSLINEKFFSTKTNFEFYLTKKIISRFDLIGNIGISYILLKDTKNAGEDFDASELVNLIISNEKVQIAVLIKQKQKKFFTVSLRSKENFDVATFASKFSGGGHKRASGFSIQGSFSHVKRQIIKELIEFEKSN